MQRHIMYCQNCKIYTLKTNCPICEKKTIRRIPPKFSFPDKYGKYRRKIKEITLKKEGLL